MILLQEHEEDRSDKASESNEVIPLQRLTLEEHDGEDSKDGDGDYLLNHLELHQGESTTIAHESHTVGGHLAGILKERQEPADEDNDVKRRVIRDELHLLKLQVTIPSERHKDVRHNE